MNGKLAATLIVGVMIGFAASFLVRQPEALAQEKRKAPSWEYEVTYVGAGKRDKTFEVSDYAKKTTTLFNTLAGDGWEYVGPVTELSSPRFEPGGNQLILFKRLKK